MTSRSARLQPGSRPLRKTAAAAAVALGLAAFLAACASQSQSASGDNMQQPRQQQPAPMSQDSGMRPAPAAQDSGMKPAPMAQSGDTGTGTRYRADADMQAVLDQLAALGGKPIEKLSVEEARRQPTAADAVKALLEKRGRPTDPNMLVPGVTSRDSTIPGARSALPVRIYTPAGNGPFPVVVYFHGGGWVIADKEVYDAGARGLAKQANAVVISVDYRRAPEAKFPAAWDDALATYRWAAVNARSIKGDPRRLALAGESAGGNLAVATAIAARDAKLQKPAAVISIYPVAQSGNMNTASYIDSANAKPLNKAMISWFLDKLLEDPATAADARLDLVNARLEGLPPVTIINAQIDPLREDGAMLEQALKKANVPVERRVYDGTTHEFFGTAAVVGDAADAQQFAGERLKQAFGGQQQRMAQ